MSMGEIERIYNLTFSLVYLLFKILRSLFQMLFCVLNFLQILMGFPKSCLVVFLD